MELSTRKLAFLSILAANVIYGLNYVIAKGLMPQYFAPRSIIFFRITGTLCITWFFSLVFVRERVKRADIGRFIVAGFFGIALNQVMFFEGLNLTTPIDSSIIMTISPILVLLLSVFVMSEKASVFRMVGIALGMAGAVIMILGKGELSFSSETFAGNLMIFINALSFALYLVIIKPVLVKYHPITIQAWTFLAGYIFTLPFTANQFLHARFDAVPLHAWFSLQYIIFFATFLGYLLYNYSLKYLSASVVSFFIYLQPLFSSTVSYFVLGTTPGWVDVSAGLCIFVGIAFISRRK